MKYKSSKYLLLLLDVLIVVFAFLFVAKIRDGTRRILADFVWWRSLAAFAAIWILSSLLGGKYLIQHVSSGAKMLRQIVQCDALAVAIVFGVMYIFDQFHYSRMIVLGTMLGSFVLEVFLLVGLYYALRFRRENRDFASIPLVTQSAALEASQNASHLLQRPQSIPVINNRSYAPPFSECEPENSILVLLWQNYLDKQEELFSFINDYLELTRFCRAQTLVLNTETYFNIANEAPATRQLFINLHRVNDFRRLNLYLRDKNIKSVYGKHMCFRVIQRIMQNEAYIGRFIYGRKKIINGKVVRLPESEWIVVERKDLAIIDRRTFDAAQKKMKKNTRKYNRNKSSNDSERTAGTSNYENLLDRDIVICGNCGGRMGTQRSSYKSKKGTTHTLSYFCTTREQFGRNSCDARSVRSSLIDLVVEERIGQLLGRKEYIKTIKSKIRLMSKPRNSEQKNEISDLKAKIAKINEKLAKIDGLGAATRLVDSQARQKTELEKQRMAHVQTIADIESEMLQNEAPLYDEQLFELLAGNFEKSFAAFSPETKRSVVATIIKKVVIKDREISSIEFQPPFDAVEIRDGNGN